MRRVRAQADSASRSWEDARTVPRGPCALPDWWRGAFQASRGTAGSKPGPRSPARFSVQPPRRRLTVVTAQRGRPPSQPVVPAPHAPTGCLWQRNRGKRGCPVAQTPPGFGPASWQSAGSAVQGDGSGQQGLRGQKHPPGRGPRGRLVPSRKGRLASQGG